MNRTKTEQEFRICSFNREIQAMSEDEVKQKLIELFKQIIEQDNHYQEELRKEWLIKS